MPSKNGHKPDVPPEDGLLGELRQLGVGGGQIDTSSLDATLLWMAVVGLAKRGASLQIGVTKDGGSWAIQVWDGKFPVKDYFPTTEALNRHLAALTRVCWKRELPAEVETLVREYGY